MGGAAGNSASGGAAQGWSGGAGGSASSGGGGGGASFPLGSWGPIGGNPRRQIKAGDVIMLPGGKAEPVVMIDIQRDLLCTESGLWNLADVEPISQVPPTNPADLEEWLQCDFLLIPRLTNKYTVDPCTCGCEYCTMAVVTVPGRVVPFSSTHQVMPACRCAAKGCKCNDA